VLAVINTDQIRAHTRPAQLRAPRANVANMEATVKETAEARSRLSSLRVAGIGTGKQAAEADHARGCRRRKAKADVQSGAQLRCSRRC
jgi:hypothetical protein